MSLNRVEGFMKGEELWPMIVETALVLQWKNRKNFGKGSIMKLGEKADQQISTVPSGSLALDVALGVGVIQRADYWSIRPRKFWIRRRLLYMRLPKFKNKAELQPLSMPNTL